MTDDHIKPEITLYLAGSLTESRNRQIEAHAASCEKCRHALSKARAKQSRIKREALKKASPDRLPNMFLARQGKEIGVDRPPRKIPWALLSVIVVGGVGFRFFRHSTFLTRSTASSLPDPELSTVQASSAAIPAAEPPPAPVPAAPAAEKPPTPKPLLEIPIQQLWQGADSGIKDVRVKVIRNKEGWDALRAEMKSTLPEVDFEQHVVLGVFAGDENPGSTVSFGKIKERADDIYAPYRIAIAEVQTSSGTAVVPDHPYALSLIPRIEKKVRLTQKEVSP